MKEDILEQLVEDWIVSKDGWFVKHNVKFRPDTKHRDYNSKKDSVHSDIDILGFSNKENGKSRVIVVTCKSWQSGFNPKKWLTDLEKEPVYNERSKKFNSREKWKYFRELVSEKWMKAFINKIFDETGQRDFCYCIAVTKINGTSEDVKNFQNSEVILKRFKKYQANIEIEIVSLEQIISEYYIRIKGRDTTTLESTDVGRLLQLINAASLEIKNAEHNKK